jgi:hypothetical protein
VDRRAVTTGRRDLRQCGVNRHVHRRGQTEQVGRERDALGVVPGTGRHDATRLLGCAQPRHPHVGATDLEGAGALQVLALEVDRHPDQLGQRAARLYRGALRHPVEQARGRADVVDAEVGAHHLRLVVRRDENGRPRCCRT